MDSYAFQHGMRRLCGYYNRKLTDDARDMYFRRIRRLPQYAWERAVDRWIDEETTFPPPGKIRRLALTFTEETDLEDPLREEWLDIAQMLERMDFEAVQARWRNMTRRMQDVYAFRVAEWLDAKCGGRHHYFGALEDHCRRNRRDSYGFYSHAYVEELPWIYAYLVEENLV